MYYVFLGASNNSEQTLITGRQLDIDLDQSRGKLFILIEILLLLLTLKDGLAVVVGALGVALLSQLLFMAAAGDVGLDEEAVALPDVQVRQLNHVGLGDVHFLQ